MVISRTIYGVYRLDKRKSQTICIFSMLRVDIEINFNLQIYIRYFCFYPVGKESVVFSAINQCF